MFVGYKLNLSANLKPVILIFYLLHGFSANTASSLVQMWVTWRYLRQSGSGTPLFLQQFTEERERGRQWERAMGEGQERTCDPQPVWTSYKHAFVPTLLWRWREGTTWGWKKQVRQVSYNTRQMSPNWIKVHIHVCSIAVFLLALMWAFQWVKKKFKVKKI